MALRCISAQQVEGLLHAGEIHVWSVSVAEWLPYLGMLGEPLNHEEHERAARFRFERDWRRFILCRGLLRTLLGNYLSRQPGDIEFRFGEQEKPERAGDAGPRLEFNLSHSDQAALFAFAAGKRVGVDIERVRSGVDVHGIAQQVLTPAEIEKLSTATETQKEDLFYAMWTQKEAYIKAIGLGLSAPVRQITVGEGLLAAANDAGGWMIEGSGARWSLLRLDAPAGYKAALSVEGPISRDQLQLRPLAPPQAA
jgi:4'-phosphopantetheinyl transferase